MAGRRSQVVVVGAGVIGLSVATHLLERFSNDIVVTIIADKFSPDTIASDRSGGWIAPLDPTSNLVYPQDPKKVVKWLTSTVKRLYILYNSDDSNSIGISLVRGYSTRLELADHYSCLNYLFAFQLVDESHIKQMYNFESSSTLPLLAFTTFILACPTYLMWMLKKFMEFGGIVIKQRVLNLSELNSYDIVVNCTGIGAKELVNDHQMYPVRGHMVSVKAPWIKQFMEAFGHSRNKVSIFPRIDDVLLGGTFEIANGDVAIDLEEIQGILNRCIDIMPNLAKAEVLNKWVGVRPFREGGIRLEKEKKEESNPIIIHCYGHSSYGVTLSWGCAEEVGDLIEKCLCQQNIIQSNL